MRFVAFVAEEIVAPAPGSAYHVQQTLAAGKHIKAGLNMDGAGWPTPPMPAIPTASS